jgi:hypothetical protein
MPFRPPAPGAFNDTSRIDERAIHIEQNCSASQNQRKERTSHEAYFLPFVVKTKGTWLGAATAAPQSQAAVLAPTIVTGSGSLKQTSFIIPYLV